MITKLGSLFDGSGGFPLAGALCGIEPIWASEIEPYPIAVTKSRLPKMKHLGEISKINGAEIEPVDIITFGSPCQDLSVAGKRAGLKHQSHGDGETTRSGLFMEAVRIIKEMREKTNGKYPRFALWENVPGAFSSNKGEDFRVVLEEIIKIAEPNAVMPNVPQKGWAYADSHCGDGWSVAYRVLDAQYWGVPQRRRRIYLVADFGGQCAREILFEREGLRGYFTQGRTPWQTATADAERGVGADDREGAYGVVTKGNGDAFISLERHTSLSTGGGQAGQGYPCTMQPIGADIYNLAVTGDKVSSLTAGGYGSTGSSPKVIEAKAIYTHPQNDTWTFENENKVQTLSASMGMGGGNTPLLMEEKPKIINLNKGDVQSKTILDPSGIAPALYAGECRGGGGECYVMDETIALEGNGQRPSHRGDGYLVTDKSYTLNTTEIHGVVYGVIYVVDQGGGKSQANVSEGMTPTLTCTHGGEPAVVYGIDVYNQTITGDKAKTLTSIKCDADHVPCVSYSFDPGASRDVGVLFIEECAKTLTNGTCPGHHDGVVIAHEPIAIDRAAFKQGENALYEPQINEDGTTSTLVAKGPSAVCYSIDEKCANTYVWDNQANTLAARDYKQPQAICYQTEEKPLGLGIQSSSGIDKMAEDATPCLINGNNPGWQIGVMTPKPTYIVRRLTPTECARLQGFADRWGDTNPKTELSDEEYKFWLDVRNTHAAINGKQTKEYTKAQMLAWYNKLHVDSSEYKMWGNGIALPTALYVMQGIKEALNESYQN